MTRFLRGLARNPVGMLGLVLTVVVLVAALGAPWLATHDPLRQSVVERFVTSAFEERESRSAGSPMSGRPSAVWMPTFVPITSKKRGTRSIWMSRSLSERIRSSISSCESFEKATITRSTSRI